MNEYNPKPTTKKVRYIASIIYLTIITFLVAGSYIHQQSENTKDINSLNDEEIIWTEVN